MQKKTNFQNMKLQSFISRRANNVMTLHTIKREWRIAIVSLIVIKLLTMIFSLFAAFGFFIKKFENAFGDITFHGINGSLLSLIFTIITLIAIELLTAVFLEKTFKFLYRQRFITCFLSAVIVTVFYSLSFISSTNGLAERQSAKKDKTEEINSTSEKNILVLKNELDEKIADYNAQIKRINQNPQGWSEGKRAFLTSGQLRNIAVIEKKKEAAQEQFEQNRKKVETETKGLLVQNNINTAKTAKDYYKFMSYIMGLQILASMILIFFYFLVRVEEQRDALINEDLKAISDAVSSHAETLIFNTIIDTSNKLNLAIQERIDASNKFIDIITPLDNIEKEVLKDPDLSTQKTTVLGFQNKLRSEKIDLKKSADNAETSKRFDTSEHLRSQFSDFLLKHKKLVVAIKKINPDPIRPISNLEIKQVQVLAKSANWKSNTTIQKVFVAMQTVGFDNISIDKKGNLKLF